MCVIAVFRGGVEENCSLLGYYTVDSGNFSGCPEMSVRNYHYSMRNNAEERSSHPKMILKWAVNE